MIKKILIPVALDHEGLVEAKIAAARKLMEDGGRITLLTVLEEVPKFVSEFVDLTPVDELTRKARARLDEIAGGAPDIDTDAITGKPGVRVAEYAADHDYDLIVVGARRPGAQDYFLGSTAARVARRAPCSVLILRDEKA